MTDHRLLDVRDVSASYGERQVLFGLRFAVNAREAVSLVGAGGAGKTTTLRLLSGLHRVEAGSLSFDGTDITHASPHARASLGLGQVAEGRRIFPGLTVAENLAVGGYAIRRQKRAIRARRDEVLDLFPQLVGRLDQRAATLSGGEQQMLLIGRAFMSRPRLLALDEVSAGLSPVAIEALVDGLRQIRVEGTALLIADQHLQLVLALSDRVLLMESGRVVLDEPCQVAASDPRLATTYFGGD
jgi:branched-chain amino acid transport system ATP-binding protein